MDKTTIFANDCLNFGTFGSLKEKSIWVNMLGYCHVFSLITVPSVDCHDIVNKVRSTAREA